ncbi:peptide ABC transporter substrate-binding protein [Pantoea rodasii]|uniref:Peptide ABC transporter substrate-binding protein n=1 Tax=Pantoea rodasii TaxID=1076549 RepID=A0A2M9WAP7_9GAMM|nr:SgrR family transcriptional regulator [Pantoea rodasii]ORM65784.1 peptide ABC transporter substrate-binding protein [Pantoea rodasii]PJZ04568.1 peptide ABC transporter substrate-binding protein [Pantoea rodasii]
MRQLHRVNQFQRLWQLSQGEPQRLSVTAMAQHCFCSERHVRTLLRQWQDAGWLRWLGAAGRGKQGELTFLISPEQLRQQLLAQQLEAGEAVQALQVLDLHPERLVKMLRPLMGGQWQNQAPVLRIPYYRALEPLQPLNLTGRAEQHLLRQIFSGLTRFHGNDVEGDLAHHWQHDGSGREWYFWLRPQLSWHNDEPIQAAQLAIQLQQIQQTQRGGRLLATLDQIDAPHPLALRIRLHQSDYWLPQRLAHQFCLLPHPEFSDVGSGPWKLTHFTDELVRLESHARWHLQRPLIQVVEYWITPQLFAHGLGTSCRHPVQIAIGDPDELDALRPVDHSISLGFCYLAPRISAHFTAAQATSLIALIQHSGVIQQLPLDEGLITPSQELLPGWPVPPAAKIRVPLPEKLTLHYHLPVELHVMAQALVPLLAQQGCTLTCVFHDVKSWRDDIELSDADVVMGDRLIGDAPLFTLVNWLENDPLWHPLRAPQLQAALSVIAQQASAQQREQLTHQLFQQLMHDGHLLPLFNYRYQVFAPPGVEGIQLNTLGWFDFTRAWIPPPATVGTVQPEPEPVP